MDLLDAIQKLYAERESLTKAIAALESLRDTAGGVQTSAPVRSRRGRKSMNPEERLEVSLRMKRYWDERRGPAKSTS